MHVSSKLGGPRSRTLRGPVAAVVTAVLTAILASLAGVAQAVEFDASAFDERVKAPMARNPTELRAQAQSYGERFAQMQTLEPAGLITNRTLFRDQFDLSWQIQRAIDARQKLGDLSAIGLESAEDGSYKLDFAAFPQWRRVDVALAAILPRSNWENLGQQLVARGFRAEDVSALRTFVAAHDPRAAALRKTVPVALSFSKVVKKYDKLKRPVPNDLVSSFLYQRSRIGAEATREWAEALLQTLDAQRARILLSYFSEMPSSGLWAPSDQEAGIADLLATMRLPNYEQLARDATEGETP